MNPDALAHHAAECPNCAAAVAGNFCHACGQETVLHPPSTREFVHEFIGHYVALEGKLWKSLGLLLFRPGRLTLEYIKGRRVRYIQPLRLYLTLSVIFFALLQYRMHDMHINVGNGDAKTAQTEAKDAKPAAQQKQVDDDDGDDGDDAHAAKAPAKPDVAASASAAASAASAASTAAHDKSGQTVELIKDDHPGEAQEGIDDMVGYVARLNPNWSDKGKHFAKVSGDERGKLATEAFLHYAPYAVFFMMPVFALYLKILYLGSGRRFGEHLLFALHTNGFAYLAFTLMMLVPKGLHLGALKWLLGLWLVFYLPAAMRRVYGGSRFFTGLRWMVLMFLHLVTTALALVGALAFGIVH